MGFEDLVSPSDIADILKEKLLGKVNFVESGNIDNEIEKQRLSFLENGMSAPLSKEIAKNEIMAERTILEGAKLAIEVLKNKLEESEDDNAKNEIKDKIKKIKNKLKEALDKIDII